MSEARTPAEAKPAATILLLRDDPFDVLMVKRHQQIDFASGALVFPGGKTHAGDEDPAWADHATGWETFDAEQRALRIGAIREAVDAEWIAPSEALRLAAAGERTVIFPTRMNLQLLDEAKSAADAVARAEARKLVTVLPEVKSGPEGRMLVLPPDAGYGPVAERMDAVMGG